MGTVETRSLPGANLEPKSATLVKNWSDQSNWPQLRWVEDQFWWGKKDQLRNEYPGYLAQPRLKETVNKTRGGWALPSSTHRVKLYRCVPI